MTAVPIFPVNAEELFSDPKVKRLLRGGEKKAFWEWTLTMMWLNKAWLPADEATISDLLDIDVRRWRSRYKPIFEELLRREIDPVVGHIYRYPKLTDVWDATAERIAKNKRLAADARAAKAAKHGYRPSAAERRNGLAAEPARAPVSEPAAGLHQNLDKIISSALPLRSGVESAKPEPDEAALAALRLKGSAPTKPTPELLKSPLLKRPRATGLMAALEPKEDDDGQP